MQQCFLNVTVGEIQLRTKSSISCRYFRDGLPIRRHVLVPTLEGLLIHADSRHDLLFATRQPSLHSPLHDPVCLIPTQPHPSGHRRSAGFLHPVNRQTLDQRGETTIGGGPRHTHRKHPMLRTLRSRDRTVQQGAVLTRIQMSPSARRFVIMQHSGQHHSTFMASMNLLEQLPMLHPNCLPKTLSKGYQTKNVEAEKAATTFPRCLQSSTAALTRWSRGIPNR